MGTELFSQKFIFPYWFYYSLVSYFTLFRRTIFMMAPVCSCNYKNSDSTCMHYKQCDASGPKVQYSINNKLYSLFADRVQPGGPHHPSDMEWKAGRHTKGFSIYCFMTNHGTENGFLKTTLYFHQQTWDHVRTIHPVWSPQQSNSQTLGTSKVHSVLRLPSGDTAPWF